MIDNIFHISDIHIRNLKRHDEYIHVFKNLYKEIESRKTQNSIIVLAGDIVHSKTDISPELINIASDFFEQISNLCPTILIAGNHDANLNNLNRLDTLSPIVDNLKLKNLFYYKDSGVYTYDNIDFVVWSVFDDTSNFIKASDVQSDRIKVGLYHGPVHTARTDTGFEIQSENVKVSMMDGFDMFLLGDIHKFQTLQEYKVANGITKPAVKYSSSLVQQSHGEDISYHGFLHWNVLKRSAEFIPVQNDWGFCTIEIQDGKLVSGTKLPPNASVRIKSKNTTDADLSRILTSLKKEIDVASVSILKESNEESVDSTNLMVDIDKDSIFKEYISNSSLKFSNKIQQELIVMHEHYKKSVPDESVVRDFKWTPLSFKFENMFSYGEDNLLEFSNMNGIFGLFAKNAHGKSSIFDALSFCLFDKCSRTSKAEDVLNKQKDHFTSLFKFKINNITYGIERNGKRTSKGSVKVNVRFWKEELNTITDLSGTQRRDTNSIIREYLGTYEDFVFTCLSIQGANSIFIDKSQSERKDLLSQLLGLNIFDVLHDVASEDLKESMVLLKNFKSKDYSTRLSSSELELEKSKERLKHLELEEKDLKSSIDHITSKIESEYQKLHKIDESLDIDSLKRKLESSKTDLQDNKLLLHSTQDEINTLTLELNDLKKKTSLYNGIEEKYNKWESDYIELNDINHKIEKHKIVSKNAIKKLESAKENLKFEVNEECDSCITNSKKFNIEYENAKFEIQKCKSIASNLFVEREKYEYAEEQRDVITQMWESHQSILNNLTKKENLIEGLNFKLDSIKSKIIQCNDSIENLNEKISKYYENESKINENVLIRSSIDSLKSERNKINTSHSDTVRIIKSVHSDVKSSEYEIDSINSAIKRAEKLEKKVSVGQEYLKLVHRDGIPYSVISNTVSSIEYEINSILNQIVDFTVKIHMDGKNIVGRIVYDDSEWPLEMASGMEKFISGIAIRIALMRVSRIPRPNFIVVDEGFGTLDSDNLNSISMLFSYLKSNFKFGIVISHLDSMRDMVDHFLEIHKVSNYSKIFRV